MREFFRGWRRKVGCAALVFALLVAGEWLRSRMKVDYLSFPVGTRQQRFYAVNGVLYLWGDSLGYATWKVGSIDAPIPNVINMLDLERRMCVADAKSDFVEWRLSLLVIATPLILLSVYLILWPRRKPKT